MRNDKFDPSYCTNRCLCASPILLTLRANQPSTEPSVLSSLGTRHPVLPTKPPRPPFRAAKVSPKALRMITEIRKAAPILALRDPPTKVILVDLHTPGDSGDDDGGRGTAVLHGDGSRRRQGSSRSGDPALPAGTEDILAKRQLAADVGIAFGDGPELRYRSLYSNCSN